MFLKRPFIRNFFPSDPIVIILVVYVPGPGIWGSETFYFGRYTFLYTSWGAPKLNSPALVEEEAVPGLPTSKSERRV